MVDLFDIYQRQLKTFLAFPSISTDVKYKDEMINTADYLVKLFNQHGFKTKVLRHPRINPVVLASYQINPSYPTLLIYGHYDVQPASQADWGYNPFNLTRKAGRFYGRGVVDNKGQVMIHIISAFQAVKTKKLRYNLKFLIEGNEETGDVKALSQLIADNKDLIKTDYVLISDGELVGGKPAIEASFRGGFNATLIYKVAKTNAHSGIFGGAVPNAVHEMAKFIDQLFDPEGQVMIPGFYDQVDPITKKDQLNTQSLLGLANDPIAELGFKAYKLPEGFDFYTATGLYPTIQVTGIKGGYIKDGYANIVVAQAEAKFNFRTVSSQKSRQVYQLFGVFVKDKTPDYVDYQLEADGFHEAVKLDTSKPIFAKVRSILEAIYQPPIPYHYVGGAIPFIATMKQLFGIDTVSVGLANQDCHMHGVDENFRVELVKKGLEFSFKFLTT